MNYNQLNHDDASFVLFSFKRTLRDQAGLTPAMIQFYEAGCKALSQKLRRLQIETDPRNDQDYDTFQYGTEPLPGDTHWTDDPR